MRAIRLAMGIPLILAASASAATFDALADFTPNSNTAGSVWTYASAPTPTGALTLLPFKQTSATLPGWLFADPAAVPYPQYDPGISKNLTGSLLDDNTGTVYPVGDLVLHPGGPDGPFGAPVNVAVLLFTAPFTGTFTFSGFFEGVAGGGKNPGAANPTSSDVHIIDPLGASVLDSLVSGFGTKANFGFTKTLQQGNVMRFVVGLGNNGSINSDSTGLSLQVVSVPEPATLGLIGIGTLFLLRRRK